MSQSDSISSLKKLLHLLKNKLEELDQDAKRDHRLDYPLYSEGELTQLLSYGIPSQAVKKLLLSQIGLVRINIMSEVMARLSLLEDRGRFDECVELMDSYVTDVALRFLPRKDTPSLINRFLDLAGRDRMLEPFEYVNKWRLLRTKWTVRKPVIRGFDRSREYQEVRSAFNMVHAVSFSDDNFPPSPTIIFVDKNRISM